MVVDVITQERLGVVEEVAKHRPGQEVHSIHGEAHCDVLEEEEGLPIQTHGVHREAAEVVEVPALAAGPEVPHLPTPDSEQAVEEEEEEDQVAPYAEVVEGGDSCL